MNKKQGKSTIAFITMLKAGLWEQDVQLLPLGDIDFKEVYQLAQEQSIVGLIAAGLEHILDVTVPKNIVLGFVGEALQIEQRNIAMNHFISELYVKLKNEGVVPVLVKGQGVAQCYERPFWRSSGDVDLYMDYSNFEHAKLFFRPLVTKFEPDNEYAKSINMYYESWVVEIHANQHIDLSSRIDRVLDDIQDDVFLNNNVRVWKNENTEIYLPSPGNDALLVFTHILKHLYKGGIGLRQICDWVRLLWMYKDSIDSSLLEKRLSEMGLMSEWNVFAALAVKTLGMPEDAMILYDSKRQWEKKSRRLLSFIMSTGNMGHGRDTSYYVRYPYYLRKVISFYIRVKDGVRLSGIFPYNSLRFIINITKNGIRDALHFA